MQLIISMFIRVKERKTGKKSIQIVESQRRGKSVTQKVIRHVGQAVTIREEEELKKLAQSIIEELKEKRQPSLPLFSPDDIDKKKNKSAEEECNDTVRVKDLEEEQRVIDGIYDVLGKLFDDLGLNKLISGTRKDLQWNAILKSCVMARLANPQSKKRTASLLEEDFGIKVPLDQIYRMMDHLYEHEDKLKEHIAQTTLNLFNQEVDVLFFDVTTLYFESISEDDLRKFGFSKDCKFKEVQVVLALIATTDGFPITYEIFPGNTYEGHTLIKVIKKLKTRYTVKNVVLVADRAMFNNDNLKEMESEELGIKYVVAAKLKSMSKKVKNQIIESKEYTASIIENELHWINEFTVNGRRVIASWSTKRAKKDHADRQRLIDRLMNKLKDGKCSVKDLIPNAGTKKYIQVEKAEASINEAKIEDDSKWDGLHGVITNIDEAEETASSILTRYRGLWQIEEAFRVNKHDLKMRPIYHHNKERIHAHIAICFLAFTIVKQSLYRIKIQQKETMSFEQLRNELLHIQSSVLRDRSTGKKYLLPSKVNYIQQKIYNAFGLKRRTSPIRL